MRNQEQQKKTSTEGIHEIKKIAGQVSKSAEVIHELPPGFVLTTPNPSHVYSFQDLETKIVKDRHLNQLAVAWIAARAKARNNEAAHEEARRVKKNVDAQSDEWKHVQRACMTEVQYRRYDIVS